MGDGNKYGGGGGGGQVLEADGVGEDLVGGEPVLVAKARGANDVIGVKWSDDVGRSVG